MKLHATARLHFDLLLEYYEVEKRVDLIQIIHDLLKSEDTILENTFNLINKKASEILNHKIAAAGTAVENNKNDYHYLLLLGFCYKYGLGTEQNNKLCFEAFKTAHESNLMLATVFLGACYVSGVGVKKDVKKAEEYIRLAANQGIHIAKIFALQYEDAASGQSIEILKSIHEENISPIASVLYVREKSLHIALMIQNAEDENAPVIIENKKKLSDLLKPLLEKRNKYAYDCAGIISEMITGNINEAIEYWERARALEHGDSIIRLAELVERNSVDYDMAARLYYNAVAYGVSFYIEPLPKLIKLFKEKTEQTKKCMEEASIAAHAVVEKHSYVSPHQYYNLGFFLYHGMGCEINLERAIQYITIAANRHYTFAEMHLAYCNEFGIGTPVNFQEAYKYYQYGIEDDLDADEEYVQFVQQKQFNYQYLWTPLRNAVGQSLSCIPVPEICTLIAVYAYDWAALVKRAAEDAKLEIRKCFPNALVTSVTETAAQQKESIEDKLSNIIAEYGCFSADNDLQEIKSHILFEYHPRPKIMPSAALVEEIAPDTQTPDTQIQVANANIIKA